jgi:uncharacterized membrane protein YraQ (UPF0718 family)
VKLRARPKPASVPLPVLLSVLLAKLPCGSLPAMAVTMRRNAAMSMPLTFDSCQIVLYLF